MIPVKDQSSGEIKYTTRSRAKVIDNRDPLKRGRIRVRHPLLGETVWIPYLKTPGLFDAPEIEDVVFIEADCGHYTHVVAWGNIVKGDDANPGIPSAFRREIPTNRGLYSPLGHKIELDDGIANPAGPSPGDVEITAVNRGIRLTTRSGNKIWMKEEASDGVQHILIEDNKGNYLRLTQQDNTFQINVKGDVLIDCENANIIAKAEAVVEAPSVKLGVNAAESVIKGDAFSTLFNAHTHLYAPGPGSPTPSAPPTVPMSAAQLSSKVKTE